MYKIEKLIFNSLSDCFQFFREKRNAHFVIVDTKSLKLLKIKRRKCDSIRLSISDRNRVEKHNILVKKLL